MNVSKISYRAIMCLTLSNFILYSESLPVEINMAFMVWDNEDI